MKVYKCDSCGKIIENPYTEEMKEFYVGSISENMGIFPINSKRKVKIHLCKNCFNALKDIAKRKLMK